PLSRGRPLRGGFPPLPRRAARQRGDEPTRRFVHLIGSVGVRRADTITAHVELSDRLLWLARNQIRKGDVGIKGGGSKSVYRPVLLGGLAVVEGNARPRIVVSRGVVSGVQGAPEPLGWRGGGGAAE